MSPKWSDTPGYLMTFHRMTYPQACQELGIEPKGWRGSRRQTSRPTWKPKEAVPPPSIWQKKAAEFVACAKKNLWIGEGAEAEGLSGGAGAAQNFIKTAKLGWNPETRYDDYETWGLPPERNEKGNPKRYGCRRGSSFRSSGGDGQIFAGQDQTKRA